MKRNPRTGLLPKPKPCAYPYPVYEAHYDSGKTVRMSFFSPAGKPIDATAKRENMLSYPYGGPAEHGLPSTLLWAIVHHNGQSWPDYPVEAAAKPKPTRVTAKQARASLGHLLACLDGSITDHDEIRKVVTEARKIAA